MYRKREQDREEMSEKIGPVEFANTWDDAVFEMAAAIERRIHKETLLPHYLLSEPEDRQREFQHRALQATALMRDQHEAMIKRLLEPASFYADPVPYCDRISRRLDDARTKAMQAEKSTPPSNTL